jgi:hypothetical protein
MSVQIPVQFMASIQMAIGGPLAGSWVSSMLFGLEILCYVNYFRKFRQDSAFVRCCVVASAMLSITNQVNQWYFVFANCVMAWGK